MEELVENPGGCASFCPNPFKKEKCKNCGRPWREHKGVITEEQVRGYVGALKKVSEEKRLQEEAEKERARAKALAKKKAAQAVEDDWLWDGADPEELDLDDEDDVGFAMYTGGDLAGTVGVPLESGARQFKVKNLIDFSECDTSEDAAASPPADSCAAAATASASSSSKPFGDPAADAPLAATQLLNGGGLGPPAAAALAQGGPPSPTVGLGEKALKEEIEHLRQMLSDAHEMKTIEISIVRDEVAEKQARIDELVQKHAEAEAMLLEARGRMDPPADQAPAQPELLEQLRRAAEERDEALRGRADEASLRAAAEEQLRVAVQERDDALEAARAAEQSARAASEAQAALAAQAAQAAEASADPALAQVAASPSQAEHDGAVAAREREEAAAALSRAEAAAAEAREHLEASGAECARLAAECQQAAERAEDAARQRDEALRRAEGLARERDEAVGRAEDAARQSSEALRRAEDVARDRDEAEAARRAEDASREHREASASFAAVVAEVCELLARTRGALGDRGDEAAAPQEEAAAPAAGGLEVQLRALREQASAGLRAAEALQRRAAADRRELAAAKQADAVRAAKALAAGETSPAANTPVRLPPGLSLTQHASAEAASVEPASPAITVNSDVQMVKAFKEVRLHAQQQLEWIRRRAQKQADHAPAAAAGGDVVQC